MGYIKVKKNKQKAMNYCNEILKNKIQMNTECTSVRHDCKEF